MTFAFFYRASLGGPDECREQKFATLVGDHFGMSPTNILLTPMGRIGIDVARLLIGLEKKQRCRAAFALEAESFSPIGGRWINMFSPAK
ncbi:hypothetical protein B9L19_00130 [Geobacillus thermocatenulatus]|uniref:Uncharacterized protein n=1 Tax=Geobacillus thermocatenulatus TaxID=33938 RepID=A0A226Q876_9BACL|nr:MULTISPECIES: hypothetical protein [Geobacillus]ASS97831.1 hypothetical protein GT3921_01445 [Geobacillus thermocatenulatus]KLR74772.1 hypothetical protein ABH20_03935 [Geobacillus sp. T6]OXB88575.1 hypothetical protein B9L19_00130 [Geobacillus thermocatenulatus]